MYKINENEIEEQEELSLEDMSKEDLINTIYSLSQLNKVDINTDNVSNLEVNQEEFKAGIDGISYLCGQFSALTSVGIDSSSAIDIILNQMNVDYNINLNHMTCENNKEIAKIQEIKIEQERI